MTAKKYVALTAVLVLVVASAVGLLYLSTQTTGEGTGGDDGGDGGDGGSPPQPASDLLLPSDLTYIGAFRLPYVDGGVDWSWGGTGAAYCPDGDPGNDDAYPGSIYVIGHAGSMWVAEVSIPEPVVSRDLSALNTATLLRGFTNIRAGVGELDELFSAADIRVGGLAYLPAQGAQTSDKLYACWGAHFQTDEQDRPSHMWCDLDFSNAAGAWRVGSTFLELYQTNDYMFEVPREYADSDPSLAGFYLATGRFREGGHGGQGPNLYAIAPWQDGNPPPDGAQLTARRLLGYSSTHLDGWDYGGGHTLDSYHDSDEWVGGAWLTAGDRAAVIFVGTKGKGDCWYGFSDGTVYPTDGSPFTGTVPDYPHDDRGYWSTSFEAQMIFYDPDQLIAVANGTLDPYVPQPYATLSLDSYLYNVDKVNHPAFPPERNKYRIGCCTFDRQDGLLYVFEYRGEPAGGDWNDDYPIVHVFSVGHNNTTASGASDDTAPAADHVDWMLPALSGTGACTAMQVLTATTVSPGPRRTA